MGGQGDGATEGGRGSGSGTLTLLLVTSGLMMVDHRLEGRTEGLRPLEMEIFSAWSLI